MESYLLKTLDDISMTQYYYEMNVLINLIEATEKSLYLEQYYSNSGYTSSEYQTRVYQEMDGDAPAQEPDKKVEPAAPAPAPTPVEEKKDAPQPATTTTTGTDQTTTTPTPVAPQQKVPENGTTPTVDKKPVNQNQDVSSTTDQTQKPQQPPQQKQLPQTNWQKLKAFVKELIHKIAEGFNKIMDKLLGGGKEAKAKKNEQIIEQAIQSTPDIVEQMDKCQEFIASADFSETEGTEKPVEEYWQQLVDDALIKAISPDTTTYCEAYFPDFFQESKSWNIVKGVNSALKITTGMDIFQGISSAGSHIKTFCDNMMNIGASDSTTNLRDAVGQAAGSAAMDAAQNAVADGEQLLKNIGSAITSPVDFIDKYGQSVWNTITMGMGAHTDVTESIGNSSAKEFIVFNKDDLTGEQLKSNKIKPDILEWLMNLGLKIARALEEHGGYLFLNGYDKNHQFVGWYFGKQEVDGKPVGVEYYNEKDEDGNLTHPPEAIVTNAGGQGYSGQYVVNQANKIFGFVRLMDLVHNGTITAAQAVSEIGKAFDNKYINSFAAALTKASEKTDYLNGLFGTAKESVARYLASPTDITSNTTIDPLNTGHGFGKKALIWLGFDIAKKTIIRLKGAKMGQNNDVHLFDSLISALLLSLKDLSEGANKVATAVDTQLDNAMQAIEAQMIQDSQQVAEAMNRLDQFFIGNNSDDGNDIISVITGFRNSGAIEEGRFKDVQRMIMDIDASISDESKGLGKLLARAGYNADAGFATNDQTGYEYDDTFYHKGEIASELVDHMKIYGMTDNTHKQFKEKHGITGPKEKDKNIKTVHHHSVFSTTFTNFFKAIAFTQPILHVLLSVSQDLTQIAANACQFAIDKHDAETAAGRQISDMGGDLSSQMYARREVGRDFANQNNNVNAVFGKSLEDPNKYAGFKTGRALSEVGQRTGEYIDAVKTKLSNTATDIGYGISNGAENIANAGVNPRIAY